MSVFQRIIILLGLLLMLLAGLFPHWLRRVGGYRGAVIEHAEGRGFILAPHTFYDSWAGTVTLFVDVTTLLIEWAVIAIGTTILLVALQLGREFTRKKPTEAAARAATQDGATDRSSPISQISNLTNRTLWAAENAITRPFENKKFRLAALAILAVIVGWMNYKDEIEAAYDWVAYRSEFKRHSAEAEKGSVEAIYNVAVSYSRGRGVWKDASAAMGWFNDAAERGDPDAQAALGFGYLIGEGVPANYAEAFFWCGLSAEQNSNWGQNCLGHLFLTGDDGNFSPNLIVAYKWFLIASQNNPTGVEESDMKLFLEPKMSTDEISAAKRLAQEWLRTKSAPK